MTRPYQNKAVRNSWAKNGKFAASVGTLILAALAVTACSTGKPSYDDSYGGDGRSQPRGSFTEK